MNYANNHGYSIIRIYQEDVWKDRIDWKSYLVNNIKHYDNVVNIMIGDVYDKYPVYNKYRTMLAV
jgi:hypothetical protein